MVVRSEPGMPKKDVVEGIRYSDGETGDPANHLLVFGAADIYVDGIGEGSVIAHFDGGAWTKTRISNTQAVSAMDRAPDGTLWVVAGDDGLFRVPRVGAAERIPLPLDAKYDSLVDVWARAPDEIWVAVSLGQIYTLRPSQLTERTP